MSDSTSDQPAPTPPIYGIEDLRAWIEQMADPTGGTPLRGYLRAALVDLLAYRVEERAGRFYHRPDGVEEIEWMRPYRELVDSLPLAPGWRDAVNVAFDRLSERTAREAARATGSEDRLREQLLRAMPQGFSTRERVAAVADRLESLERAIDDPLRPRTSTATTREMLSAVVAELRSIAGPPVPACSCPHEPSLLCAVPQHRADAVLQGYPTSTGRPDDLSLSMADQARQSPEYARALYGQRTAAEPPDRSGG